MTKLISLAVVGAGRWGPNLLRNFHNKLTSQVTHVVDVDAGRLAQIRARYADIATHEDPAAVFRDPDVDAVVIATPTSTHHALVSAALAAGKHVMVEKPVATSAREADELTAHAARANRVLLVGHVFLFNAGVQRVKRYVTDGELGRCFYVSMERTNLGPIRMDVDAAWDLASHDISIANFWFDAQPVSVSAQGGAWINPGIADAVFATLRYPNEVLVHLHVSWLNPRKSRLITVVGERKMLTFDDMNLLEPVRIYDKQVTEARSRPSFVDSFATFRSSVREGDITIPPIALGEPLKAECDHFIECIAGQRPALCGGREGAAVVRVLEALDASRRSAGREQEVAPCP